MKQILFISIICLVSVITLTSGPCDLPAGCPDKKFAYSRCLNGVLSNWCSSNPFYDKSTGTFVQPIRFTCFTNDLDNSFTVIKHSVHYSGYQYIQHFKDDGPTGYPDYGTFHDGMKIFSADSTKDEILRAYKDSVKGVRYICNYVSNILINTNKSQLNLNPKQILTQTEQEILKDIALGRTTKEIAVKRFVSIHTIMTHRKNIFRKIEVNNVHEATKYAMRAGIVDLAEYYI